MNSAEFIHATNESSPQGTTSGTLSDEELVTLARSGNADAFDELIKRHRGACLKQALFRMRNLSDAEDAVQTACRKAFQHLEQFQGSGTFRAWLFRIVENQCLVHFRKEKTARFVYLDNPIEPDVHLDLVGRATSPEDELGQQEVLNLLQREISRMPPTFRNIMVLHDGDQVPMSDVAKRFGLSVPAAKSRLLRARKELRARIERHCGRKGPGTLLENGAHNQIAWA
jgi:RNA polymerase sigma-70 factor, ECF subfamily